MGTVYVPAAVGASMRTPTVAPSSLGTAVGGENVHAAPAGRGPQEKLTGSENAPVVERSVMLTVAD
jgi:hypothetical protein